MAPLPDPTQSLTGEDRAIYDRMLAIRQSHGTGLYGPYVALMNHPALAERVERLGGFLKFEGTLPREIYQFAVLAFARETGVEFEWADHVGPARAAGLPEEVIGALESGSEDLPQPYALVRETMRTIMAYRSLPADLQDRVEALVGVKGLLELVALCGLYSLIGYVNCSFDVPLPKRQEV